MKLKTYQIMTLVDFLEEFIEEKSKITINMDLDHGNLNRRRTVLVDYLEELFGEEEEK